MTTTDVEQAFFDAANAAMKELVESGPDYVPEDELLTAGYFVARFGSLGDLYDDPALTRMQHRLPIPSALGLIGHWSVERNEPSDEPPAEFGEHMKDCRACDYLESAIALRTMFEHERCHECGLDLDGHDVDQDSIGKAHAFCRHGAWDRLEPAAVIGFELADDQIGDAYAARWVSLLANGSYAVVTRTYYIAKIDGAALLKRDDEYLVCDDPNKPYDNEHEITGRVVDVESDDPAGEDPCALAEQSFEPEPGEWQHNGPEWAVGLLAAAQGQ